MCEDGVWTPRAYRDARWVGSSACTNSTIRRDWESPDKPAGKTGCIGELWIDWETFSQWLGWNSDPGWFLSTALDLYMHAHTHVKAYPLSRYAHSHPKHASTHAHIHLYTYKNGKRKNPASLWKLQRKIPFCYGSQYDKNLTVLPTWDSSPWPFSKQEIYHLRIKLMTSFLFCSL